MAFPRKFLQSVKQYHNLMISGPLTCDSGKVLYLLKWKVCGEVPYVRKTKTKFRYRFNNCKSKHRAFRKYNFYQKVLQKPFHAHYCFDGHNGIDDWNFVIFEQWAVERKRNLLATQAYPIGLNEKEEYLNWHRKNS